MRICFPFFWTFSFPLCKVVQLSITCFLLFFHWLLCLNSYCRIPCRRERLWGNEDSLSPPSFLQNRPVTPPTPAITIPSAQFSAGFLFSLRLQFVSWITALYSARAHGVSPVYLFSVPELNAGCFFVLMPSAKEFQRLGRGAGEEEGQECQ